MHTVHIDAVSKGILKCIEIIFLWMFLHVAVLPSADMDTFLSLFAMFSNTFWVFGSLWNVCVSNIKLAGSY